MGFFLQKIYYRDLVNTKFFCINVFIKRPFTSWGMERGGCYSKVLLLIENA